MTTTIRLAFALIAFVVLLARGQDPGNLQCEGRITAIATDARRITVDLVTSDSTPSSKTFSVGDKCKITTKGFGTYDELKKDDVVKITYTEANGVNEASQISTVTGGYVPDGEAMTVACAGQLTAVATNARRITADVKVVGGTTSKVFAVSDQCKITTKGFGVYDELKRGDNVLIEYVEKGGENEARKIAVQFASAPPAKSTTPAKPPAKKPPPKKVPPKKK